MQKYLLFYCLFIGGSLALKAQHKNLLNYPSFGDMPSLNIKLAPLAMTEPYYHTIEGAVEYKFHSKYSMQLQFGYGNSNISLYKDDYDDEAFETFRTRLEFRKYILPYMGRLRNKSLNRLNNDSYKKHLMDRRKRGFPYWAVELAWRNTTLFEDRYIDQNCMNGVCSYSKYGVYRFQKNLGIAVFKVGKQRFYGKHFFLDYYLGMGFRVMYNRYLEGEQNLAFEEEEDLFPFIDSREPGTFLLPSFSASIKLGYSIALKK